MGALHVQLVRERLAEEFKIIQVPLGPAHVSYQATLHGPATARGTHEGAAKKRTRIRKGIVHKHGGQADAWVRVELTPAARGTGIKIEDPAAEVDPTRGGQVLASAAGGIPLGITRGLKGAGPGGIPITDVRVRVLGAEASGEEAALADAAEHAVIAAVEEASAGVAVLEPIVQLEVEVPKSSVDGVVEDLQHRRGEVWGTRPSEGDAETVDAEVPLRELLDYMDALRKLTNGEGSFTYQERGWREVSSKLEQQIKEKELCAAPAH